MLIGFRFKNCRSFYQENYLSMEATSDKELRGINTFTVDSKAVLEGENEFIKSAIIFGANASGKSNVIKAISYMRNCLMQSAAQLPIIANNEPFLFYDGASDEESVYEVEIIQNETYYRYGFAILHGRVEREWLERRKERITKVFERNRQNLEITGLSRDAVKLLNITPNTLFLSVGNNFKLDIAPYLNDVMKWFLNLLIVFENNANSFDIYTLAGGKYKDQAVEILKRADIGIRDIRVIKDKVANMSNFNDVLRFNTQIQINPNGYGQLKQENADLFNIDLETSFQAYDKDNNETSLKKVRLFKNRGFNSEGTERLLYYMGWILAALDQGRVIFVDEVDSKLHFLVADYIINLFNSIDVNSKNAQLICTAHNVMLMDGDIRRDQIYFTSKDKYGVSTLQSLSDYKNVRKSDLFSKKYLAGFYTELPNMRYWN